MHEFVPTYETLYDNEKLGLRHTARSVYIGLCIKARKDRGDRVRLPLGADLVTGVWRLVGGKIEEVEDALAEEIGALRWPIDPAVRVEGEEGHLTVVVLAQRAWTLGGQPSGDDGAPVDAKTRRRQADAERKRNARKAARGADASALESGQDADMTADASAKRPQNDCGQGADTGGVRGGVSGVQTQKKREEKRAEERRGENADAPPSERGQDADRTADADAAADEDAERRMPAPKISIGDVEGLLREVPALAEVADNPTDVSELHAGFLFACGDAATVDLARRALGAFVSRERLGDMDARKKRERAGSYLAKARQYDGEGDRRQRPSEPGASAGDAHVVLDVFAAVWSKKKGKDFAPTTADDRRAAELVEPAREQGRKLGVAGRDVIRHRAQEYLADREPFVADKDHPFSLFVARYNQYGLPKPKRTGPPPPAALPDRPPPSPEEAAALAAAARGQLAQIGSGPREPTARRS